MPFSHVSHACCNPSTDRLLVLVQDISIPSLEPVLAMICTMAALNAAVTRTPVSTTLLLAKLTGFSSFTPILFASLVGFFLAPKVPFIASQLKLKQEAPEN